MSSVKKMLQLHADDVDAALFSNIREPGKHCCVLNCMHDQSGTGATVTVCR